MAQKRSLGIVGGMGSVAAAYIFDRLIKLTPALTDQDYIETFIHNNSRIPDRTHGVLYGGPSPLPELKRSVKLLNDLEVDCIIFACMTSHYFIEELQRDSKAELINAVKETAQFCFEKYGNLKKFGILASNGNLEMELFQKQLSSFGLESVVFDDKDQRHYFTKPIYQPWGVKAGNATGKPKERFLDAVERLRELGAEAVVAGCSELPLVLTPEEVSLPLIDSIDCLCNRAIRRCLHAE